MGKETDDDHHHTFVEVRGENGDGVANAIESFKKDRGIDFVLAFSGGADDSRSLLTKVIESIQAARITVDNYGGSDIETHVKAGKRAFVEEIVTDILRPFRGYRLAVLTGGTAWGVPQVATEVAKSLGFATIGVMPLVATKKPENMLNPKLLDFALCVHPFVGESCWGDESAIFTKLLDAAVVIGGGAGTMVEVTHLLKQNESSKNHTKHIIPISGTGGTADKLSYFPGKPETMVKCLPPRPIVDGNDAYRYLIDIIATEDFQD